MKQGVSPREPAAWWLCCVLAASSISVNSRHFRWPCQHAETQHYVQSLIHPQTMSLDNTCLRKLVESCRTFVVVVAIVLLNARGSSRAANEAAHSQSQRRQSHLHLTTGEMERWSQPCTPCLRVLYPLGTTDGCGTPHCPRRCLHLSVPQQVPSPTLTVLLLQPCAAA